MRRFISIALGAVLLSLPALSQTGRHGDGHAAMHDQYREWTQPDNGVSCCHDEDCRPTRAYRDEDGQWHAWDGKRWVAIPPNKLLPTDKAGDGRNHLCERWGTVYCFSPTSPRI